MTTLTPCTTLADILERLKLIGDNNMRCEEEDFSAYDSAGGNFDDAYAQGLNDGRIELARELYDMLLPLCKKINFI